MTKIDIDVDKTINKINKLIDTNQIKSEVEIDLIKELLTVLEKHILITNNVKSLHDAMPYSIFKKLKPITNTYLKLKTIGDINEKKK